MDKRIEQEINKTLNCIEGNPDIQISPLFTENLNSKIASIKVSRITGYQSFVFYPALIVLLVILNFSTGFVSFKDHKQVNGSSNNQISILANEYGIGQNSDMTF